MRRGGVPQKIYWEGNILNKISKKIVSLVTTAAFLTTLVPAAAFAAAPTTDASTATVEVNAANTITVDADLNTYTNVPGDEWDNVKVKVELYATGGTATLTPASVVANTTNGVETATDADSLTDLEAGVDVNGPEFTTDITVPEGTYTAVVSLSLDGGTDYTVISAPAPGVPVTVLDGSIDLDKSTFEVSSSAANTLYVEANLVDAYGNPADETTFQNVATMSIVANGVGSNAEVDTKGFEQDAESTVATLADGRVLDGGTTITANYTGVAAGTQTVAVYVDLDGDGAEEPVALNVADGASASATVADSAQANVSRLLIDDQEKTADATEGTAETVEFDLNAPLAAGQHLYLYAQSDDKIVDVIEVTDLDGNAISPESDNSAVYDVTAFANSGVKVTFTSDGTYVLYGAIDDDSFALNEADELQPITVTVAPKAFETEYIKMDDASLVSYDTDKNITYWNYVINDNVTPNGLKEYTIKGTAYTDAAQTIPAENEVLRITCQNAGLELDDAQVTTNAKGEFEFTFSLTDTGSFVINVAEANNDAFAEITVTQNAMAPVSISTVKDGGILLAGTDSNYVYNDYDTFGEAVQFNIKDAYDRDATGDQVLALVAAAHKSTDTGYANRNDFIDVTAPDGSKLTDDDMLLVWDGSVYTLQYVGDDPVHDLIPGEYTVKVSLNNGKSATATFTLAEFQGAESLEIGLSATDQGTSGSADNNAITTIDDQVALGQNVEGAVYLVDAQGLKILAPASNLSVGVNGAAVASNSVTLNNPFSFTTVDNIPANQSVIGSIITVQAYDEVNRMYVEKTLNVVSNYGDETLSFDPTQGPVGETNGVDVTVVDANDKLSKVNGTMTAYIASQSNEDANITLRANEAVNDGEGRLYLTSDAAGTVDVVVAVKADNGEMYAKTLTYTFGDEDPYAGTSVVMTIGSDQYLINNELFDGSVDNLGAPYVDSAWRTMVPARILAETFGGTVEFDEVDGVQTVSIVNGDTTIEMTVGSADYTINGEAAKAMDTEPVIVDGRTYVPVRFVAEGLGLDVTPLYDAETGTTASVVFQK